MKSEMFRILAQFIDLNPNERGEAMRHLGLAIPEEANYLMNQLGLGAAQPALEVAPHVRLETPDLVELLPRTKNEQERALLSLLSLEADAEESAAYGKSVNAVLAKGYKSKNIGTPLGKLIEISQVERIDRQGNPRYWLTRKGLLAVASLLEDLEKRGKEDA